MGHYRSELEDHGAPEEENMTATVTVKTFANRTCRLLGFSPGTPTPEIFAAVRILKEEAERLRGRALEVHCTLKEKDRKLVDVNERSTQLEEVVARLRVDAEALIRQKIMDDERISLLERASAQVEKLRKENEILRKENAELAAPKSTTAEPSRGGVFDALQVSRAEVHRLQSTIDQYRKENAALRSLAPQAPPAESTAEITDLRSELEAQRKRASALTVELAELRGFGAVGLFTDNKPPENEDKPQTLYEKDLEGLQRVLNQKKGIKHRAAARQDTEAAEALKSRLLPEGHRNELTAEEEEEVVQLALALRKVQSELRERTLQHKSLEDTNYTLQGQVEILNASQQELTEEIATVQAQLVMFQVNNQTLEEENGTLQGHVEALGITVRELMGEVEEWKREARMTAPASEWAQELSKFVRDEACRLRNENDQLKRQLADRPLLLEDSDVTRLRRGLELARQELRGRMAEIQSLRILAKGISDVAATAIEYRHSEWAVQT